MSQNKNHYLGITDRVPSPGFPCGSSWRVLVQIAGSSDGGGQVSDGQRSSVSQFRHRCTRPGLCPWNRNTRDSRAYSHTGKHRDEISCFISVLVSLFRLHDFNILSWLRLGSWNYPRLPWTKTCWMWSCGGVASLRHHRFAHFAYLLIGLMFFFFFFNSSFINAFFSTGNTALTGANLLFEMLCVLPNVKYYWSSKMQTNSFSIQVAFKTNKSKSSAWKENESKCNLSNQWALILWCATFSSLKKKVYAYFKNGFEWFRMIVKHDGQY